MKKSQDTETHAYTVYYNDWGIPVKSALNPKQAVCFAWLKFNDAYPLPFIDFARYASAEQN